MEQRQLRPLGQTGVEVTPIGLGVMQFSGSQGVMGFMLKDLSQPEMNQIVQAALDGGINWFDTAEMYGRGNSERALAAALKAAGLLNGQAVIATKWLPLLRTAGNIGRTIGDRLRFLGGYPIDLYMIHHPWGFSSPEAEMNAMADLVEAGHIRTVGVSNFDEKRMRRAHAALAKRGLPLAANQMQYSLLHRDIEQDGVLAAAKELGITIIAWSPLARGILSGRFHQDPSRLNQVPPMRRRMLRRNLERSQGVIDLLQEIAPRYEVTPAQVALNWVIHAHGDTIVAIPGASRVQQAQSSAAVMSFRLTQAEMDQLEAASSRAH